MHRQVWGILQKADRATDFKKVTDQWILLHWKADLLMFLTKLRMWQMFSLLLQETKKLIKISLEIS